MKFLSKKRWALLFVWLLACSPSAFTEDNVFGEDDRVPMLSTQLPWSTIGKFHSPGGNCSATLVFDDLILTAAHCVLDEESGKTFSELHFYPNMIDGVYKHVANGSVVAHGEYILGYSSKGKAYTDTSEDWAIVRLDQSLGKIYGYMGFKHDISTLPAKVTSVGYSGDFEYGYTAGVHEGCSIHSYNYDTYFHDCDDTGGSSGGPMFMFEGNEAFIVGVNVASYKVEAKDLDEKGLIKYSSSTSNVGVRSNQFYAKLIELRNAAKNQSVLTNN